MALLQINHKSNAVKTNLLLNIALPDITEEDPRPIHERKVLWLLHGLSADASAWIRYGNADWVARQFGVIIIMPSGDRSFYANMDNGQHYFSYLTEELPEWIDARLKFNLTRDNSLIAGLSMGGYGAFMAALRRPDLYCEAASFSGLLSIEMLQLPDLAHQDPVLIKEFGIVFGGLETLPGSVYDPLFWLQEMAETPEKCPRLFASIGLDDDLLHTNRTFAQQALAYQLPLTYVEDEGEHTWPFWQKYLPIWLKFVLGDSAKEGLHDKD